MGKTSLYHRIVHDSFSEEPRSPSGLYEGGLERGVYRLRVDGDEVEVCYDSGHGVTITLLYVLIVGCTVELELYV